MTSNKKKSPDQRGVVLYARVSDPRQAEQELSIPAQLDQLRTYCKENGYRVLHEFEELGVSATDDKRPAFKTMMAKVLSDDNLAAAILVVHSSRFMRNTFKAKHWKNRLKKNNVRVLSISQETGDDPEGRLMETVFESFDEYASDIAGVRTTAGMSESAKQGFLPHRWAPYGFMIEKVQVTPNISRNRMIPNPEERMSLIQLFQEYVGGLGAKKTAQALNKRGLRYRKEKFWSKELVLKLLDEEAAIGTYYFGKTARRREDCVPIKVEPIIDTALFLMAKRIRKKRDPTKTSGRTGSSPMLLAGLVKCGKCKSSYQLETSGKLDPNGKPTYRYYNCRQANRIGKLACPGFRIPAKLMDKSVMDHIGDQLFTEERCRMMLRDVVEESGILRRRTSENRKQLRRELDDVTKRVRRWEEAFETGALLEELGTQRVIELRNQQAELAETLDKIGPLRSPPPNLYTQATITRFRDSIREMFAAKDSATAKNYLRFLVAEIVVLDANVQILTRTDAALRMMAETKNPTSVLSADGEVRTTVVDWLPNDASSANFESGYVIDLDRARKRLRPKKLEPPTIVNRLAKAEEWQRQLDAGDVKHRAAISRREGISRARVTQIMQLLKLHPSVLDYVRSLAAETPERMITERSLRGLMAMPHDKQLESARLALPDLADFLSATAAIRVEALD